MKWKNSFWIHILFFIIGGLFCYISLKFTFFKIETEINVSELLVSMGTAVIGIYIAHTIQKNLNKNQNQYSYIEDKLDRIWTTFNAFSQSISYSDTVNLSDIANLNSNVIHPLSFLKNIFISFEIDDINAINKLETELESFETFVSNLPVVQNSISIINVKTNLEIRIIEINKCFSLLLKEIQNI